MTEQKIDKLEVIFKKRYRELCSDMIEDEEFFVNWCSKHKIVMVHQDWVQDELNNRRRNMVCIMSPEEGISCCPWLLVPKKFAEKTLMLGWLP